MPLATVAAASAASHAAVQIVILLSMNGFQALLPAQSLQPSPVFADTAAGSAQFFEWLEPRYPKGRWNPPPTQVCVVGTEPFSSERQLMLPNALHRAQGPWRRLEPYAATFHFVPPPAASAPPPAKPAPPRGVREALALCRIQARGR